MTFVSDTSQSQIKEVVRYLKRVSWDFCGIELLYSDLIDMAIEANKWAGIIRCRYRCKNFCKQRKKRIESIDNI